MTRILADLPDEDIKWLDQLAAEQGKSRASVLREALVAYHVEMPSDNDTSWIDKDFGLWARHGVEYDLHEDDRQRQIYRDMLKRRYPEVIVNEESNK
jgi:hypothetical protein